MLVTAREAGLVAMSTGFYEREKRELICFIGGKFFASRVLPFDQLTNENLSFSKKKRAKDKFEFKKNTGTNEGQETLYISQPVRFQTFSSPTFKLEGVLEV